MINEIDRARAALAVIPANLPRDEWHEVGRAAIAAGLTVDALHLERKNARPEAAALTEVLKALESHPTVAWCHRMNSGAFRIGKRFVRFGWPGCPDVLGQLKDASAGNATKHGMRSRAWLEQMRKVNEFLRQCREVAG